MARALIEKGATIDYEDKVSQSCMIHIITVVLKNGVVIGIRVHVRHDIGSNAHWIHSKCNIHDHQCAYIIKMQLSPLPLHLYID